LEALGTDAVYLAFDVAPDRLMQVLPAMREMGFGGVNLTVPLKETAFRGLADLDESARRLGAVNTVAFPPEGGMKGYNTDGDGFLLALAEAFDASVGDRAVFVLGCGGAGRAVALTCAAKGAAAVCVGDTDTKRSRRVRAELRDCLRPGGTAEDCPTDRESLTRAAQRADIVVQATPVGMHRDEPSPLPASAFRQGQLAYDLVYMYPETDFMRKARAAGARTANGLGMLLHQGARAFTIWTGRAADTGVMREALERGVYGKACSRIVPS
jgi:shikimate dehydrogenase